jgi:predicted MPP superfamily phosphohydrolase
VNKALMFRFLFIFTAIAVLVCGSTFIVFKRRLGLSKKMNKVLGSFMLLIALLMVVSPIIYRMSKGESANSTPQFILQFTQYFLLGWVGINFMVFMFLELVQMLAKPFDPQKRIFLTEGVARGLVAGTFIVAFGGLHGAVTEARIVATPIKLPNLPKSFQGLTIAQISDVHIGPILKKGFLDGIVDQVMSLNADMIFITGDLVDGTLDQLKSQMEPLKRLKAKDGIYFCTGNHEFYSGVAEWMQYLEGIGIHVFKNTNLILTRKNSSGVDEKILLAGVHDWHGEQFSEEYKSDAFAASKTTEKVDCKILLAHNPYSIDAAAQAGFNLQISGHTHAGQFYPFVFLVKLRLKHSEGLYQINDQTQLYVNRGTGFWGPPNRLGKHSEITHYTLS